MLTIYIKTLIQRSYINVSKIETTQSYNQNRFTQTVQTKIFIQNLSKVQSEDSNVLKGFNNYSKLLLVRYEKNFCCTPEEMMVIVGIQWEEKKIPPELILSVIN